MDSERVTRVVVEHYSYKILDSYGINVQASISLEMAKSSIVVELNRDCHDVVGGRFFSLPNTRWGTGHLKT